MIPARLIEALAEEIRDATKDYVLKAEGQADKKLSVYCQHIPDEKFMSDSYYPLVIVSVQNVEDDEQGISTATIGLTIGVYGEDEQAWMDLLSIMERIRQRVCMQRIIDRKYALVLPNKWETVEAQPYPYWYGYATLKYRIGHVSL
ncbi:MAG: hypothetical protein MR853_05030 [Selenomonadales bacterium]|nr:hypothetical protein [Selenomonadales bacterium]